LISAKGFNVSVHGDIALFELGLCKNQDSRPHWLSEIRRSNMPNKWRVLKAYGANLDGANDLGQTALIQSLRENDPNSARELIDLGADINAVEVSGRTALHYAIRERNEEIALLLVDKGADIHAPVRHGSLASFVGSTPLHLAAGWGCLRTASRLLEKGARIDAIRDSGETPLHVALQGKHEDLAVLLISKGADARATVGTDGSRHWVGMTPLHFAARYGHVRAASMLIDNGADVNAVNAHGDTPAHLAIRYNEPRILELLLSRGANIHLKDKQSSRGSTLDS
jgi:ankyrin repeat protein